MKQWAIKGIFIAHCRLRPVGQAVKTPPFHGGNTSSILVRVTTDSGCVSSRNFCVWRKFPLSATLFPFFCRQWGGRKPSPQTRRETVRPAATATLRAREKTWPQRERICALFSLLQWGRGTLRLRGNGPGAGKRLRGRPGFLLFRGGCCGACGPMGSLPQEKVKIFTKKSPFFSRFI